MLECFFDQFSCIGDPLLEQGNLSFLLANPMPLLAEELSTTVQKLSRHDIFGLEKYLTWVFERRGTWRDRYNLAAADLTPAAYKRTIEGRPAG